MFTDNYTVDERLAEGEVTIRNKIGGGVVWTAKTAQQLAEVLDDVVYDGVIAAREDLKALVWKRLKAIIPHEQLAVLVPRNWVPSDETCDSMDLETDFEAVVGMWLWEYLFEKEEVKDEGTM